MNKILIFMIIGLLGCSSAYEKAYLGITATDRYEGLSFYTYWVEQENYAINPNTTADQDLADRDLKNCKRKLENKAFSKHIKNSYVASVALIECMSDKGWKATVIELVILT